MYFQIQLLEDKEFMTFYMEIVILRSEERSWQLNGAKLLHHADVSVKFIGSVSLVIFLYALGGISSAIGIILTYKRENDFTNTNN